MNELLKMHIKTDEPEIEIVQDPFTLDMNITDALRIIQKNERGRSYRARLVKALKSFAEGGARQGGRMINRPP